MLSVDYAITRFRRDLTFSALLKAVLAFAAGGALMLNTVTGGHGVDGTVVLAVVGAVWLLLSYRSIRGSRLAAQSPSLIASGHYDEAEEQIEQALRSFSLFRAAKVLSIHHLALLRHAQKRWQEAAVLCRTLLGQRLGALQTLNKPSRLILADSLLELGDTAGAYQAIAGLYDQRLTLGEAMNLLLVQLHYEARIGAWDRMLGDGIVQKVELAELMPVGNAVRAQAFLALAAQKLGRADWAQWLRRRIELLADVQQLCAERPMLWEVWGKVGESVVGSQ
jgi:hypothetical protein